MRTGAAAAAGLQRAAAGWAALGWGCKLAAVTCGMRGGAPLPTCAPPPPHPHPRRSMLDVIRPLGLPSVRLAAVQGLATGFLGEWEDPSEFKHW